jgi:hypothetical protein
MEPTVSIQSVTRQGSMGILVSGTGSPDGASVTVHIQLTGGGSGNNATQVNNGSWSTTVPMQSNPGQTGTATATASSGGHSAEATKNFTL